MHELKDGLDIKGFGSGLVTVAVEAVADVSCAGHNANDTVVADHQTVSVSMK